MDTNTSDIIKEAFVSVSLCFGLCKYSWDPQLIHARSSSSSKRKLGITKFYFQFFKIARDWMSGGIIWEHVNFTFSGLLITYTYNINDDQLCYILNPIGYIYWGKSTTHCYTTVICKLSKCQGKENTFYWGDPAISSSRSSRLLSIRLRPAYPRNNNTKVFWVW